jgi:hypothetical protein
MSVFHNDDVNNLEIRRLDNSTWALGKPKKIETVCEIILMKKKKKIFFCSFLNRYLKWLITIAIIF